MDWLTIIGLLIVAAAIAPGILGPIALLAPFFIPAYLEVRRKRRMEEKAAEVRRQQQNARELARQEQLRKSQEWARQQQAEKDEMARQQERTRLRELAWQQERARQQEMAKRTKLWLQDQQVERQLSEERQRLAFRCSGICSSCQRSVCIQQSSEGSSREDR